MKNIIALTSCLFLLASPAIAAPTIIIVQGAAGTDEYGELFSQWRLHWEEAGKKAGAQVITHGVQDFGFDQTDKSRFEESLAEFAAQSSDELWIVLLGHGTYDGRHARFNLRGPDVSADELAAWLKPVDRPVAVINCFSASGPFMSALSVPAPAPGARNRVIITATRSGHELNFSRFGGFLAQAIASPAADLDKDGQTSLLEAYLLASRQTQEWYKEQGRLATEHALIEDTGDGLGTPAQWFQGVRAVKKANDNIPLDGFRANQWCLIRSERERAMPADIRAKRDELELKINHLRDLKSTLTEEAYFATLETLAIELSRLSADEAGK